MNFKILWVAILVSALPWNVAYSQVENFSSEFFECRWLDLGPGGLNQNQSGFNIIPLPAPDYLGSCAQFGQLGCDDIAGTPPNTVFTGDYEIVVPSSSAVSIGGVLVHCSFPPGNPDGSCEAADFATNYCNLKAIDSLKGQCLSGQLFNPYTSGCEGFCPDGETWLPPDGQCGRIEDPCPNCGCPVTTDPDLESPGLGNPCNPATGNKYQTERDFTDNNGSLSVTRSYNSDFTIDLGFGQGWIVGFLKSLSVNDSEVFVRRGSGRYEIFTDNVGQWDGPAFTRFSLENNASGFIITKNRGDIETYNQDGKIVSETSSTGRTTTYSYNSNNQLETITNHFGQSVNITWNQNNHIESITDPHGDTYTYSYDASDNLISVQYPDGFTRTYHYENVDFPGHLTGITDENGDRYATFAYDSEGRAVSTEHADIGGGGAQEKFQINFGQ